MILSAVAVIVLDIALAWPERFGGGGFGAPIAIELPVLLAALWLMPAKWRLRSCDVLAGVFLVAFILRCANTATAIAFDRPFDAGVDFALIPAGIDLAVRSHGWAIAASAVIGAIIACIGVVTAARWALRRVAMFPQRPRTAAIGAAVIAVLMLGVPAGWADFATAKLMYAEARTTLVGMERTAAFRRELAVDPLQTIADDRLYNALRGHDVLVVFVESYGRVAIDDPRYADIDRQLDAMTAHLADATIYSQSAWLTSPTFGGESWFAHSTLMSGLWVDDTRRFDVLLHSNRPNMIGDFHRAGWRTVAVMPEITEAWEAGKYFAPDTVYDAPALGFAGAPLAYVTMPDQFTLAQLQAKELRPRDRKPVMAEIALVSSHAPWTPLPKLVPWLDVGKGKIFDTAREGATPEEVWADPDAVRVQYGRSIAYVLSTLESYMLTFGDARTVMIVLGDHQPMSFISGEEAPREVPIHIIARDPAVFAALNDWHWTRGMRPDTNSPVWRMDEMRERLARAFSTER